MYELTARITEPLYLYCHLRSDKAVIERYYWSFRSSPQAAEGVVEEAVTAIEALLPPISLCAISHLHLH